MVLVNSWCSLDGCCWFLVLSGWLLLIPGQKMYSAQPTQSNNPYWAVVLSLNQTQKKRILMRTTLMMTLTMMWRRLIHQ